MLKSGQTYFKNLFVFTSQVLQSMSGHFFILCMKGWNYYLICINIKSYFRYKTITSQNVPSEAQIKNFFISQKNYVPFSRYSSFCILNHPMIYQICDVTMSISAWNKVHFWIYLLNHTQLTSHQIWPVDSSSKSDNFQ